MSTVCGALGMGFAVFFLLESAQRSACVSTLFLRWINRWQWWSHCSDSPPLLISLPRSRALGGLRLDVLVPCMYGLAQRCGPGDIQSQFVLNSFFSAGVVWIVNRFMDYAVCSLSAELLPFMTALSLSSFTSLCIIKTWKWRHYQIKTKSITFALAEVEKWVHKKKREDAQQFFLYSRYQFSSDAMPWVIMQSCHILLNIFSHESTWFYFE